jgi:hypothetical protein
MVRGSQPCSLCSYGEAFCEIFLKVSYRVRCDDDLDRLGGCRRSEVCDARRALLDTRSIQSVSMSFPLLLVNNAYTRLVPILGMLCGNAIGGIMVSQSYVLKELELVILSLSLHLAELNPCSENRDKTETFLAFGASRFEACRPLAVEALRLSLLPTINQMRYANAFRSRSRLTYLFKFRMAA